MVRGSQDHMEDENSELSNVPHLPHRVLKSSELLQGKKQLSIVHGSEVYRLRLTAGGKLLLTK
jgi:hemin uptake protein HemP